MGYDRLPLINDSSEELVKMLSISVLERGFILVGMVICGNHKYGLKIFLSDYHFRSVKGQC